MQHKRHDQQDIQHGGFRELLTGTNPKLKRMLRYWAATGFFYLISMTVLVNQVDPHGPLAHLGTPIVAYCVAGVLSFFVLVRFSQPLGIAPALLAFAQGLFAMSVAVAAYAVLGPIRGASLVVLTVVIVFCIFSLRPRAIMWLCGLTIAMLGIAMSMLVRIDPDGHPPSVELTHFVLASTALIAVTVLTGEMSKLRLRLKSQKEELVAAVNTIRTLATIDELTSLANRRYMNEVLQSEERRQSRPGESVCVALLDIDHFKKINDSYGHAGGDAVLRAFAAAARAELRSADVLARWGGEEFLLLLPDTELHEAQAVLRRMAERVSALGCAELGAALTVTFSGGVVQRSPGEPFNETIRRADEATYRAKSAGRNRVMTG